MLKRLDILGRFTCAVACLLCAALPAKASPSVITAADFVRMVDARLYSPATHGLKSPGRPSSSDSSSTGSTRR